MKKLTTWRSILVMTVAALSLASCNSNNDSEPIVPKEDENPQNQPVIEEKSITDLSAEMPQTGKVYLGSGYDVTGPYLSNACLRENVVDLNKLDGDAITKLVARSGEGSLVSGVDNAWGFLNGLRVAEGFKLEGEPGDVYFAGTFTDNPLFKEPSERGDDYYFLMYMDRYTFYIHKFLVPNKNIERILTDEFKKALAEETPERIVERFGTHVLKRAMMGLNILSFYRSGLKVNAIDADRFTRSMFRRMTEVYNPIFWGVKEEDATKGGALSVQFHGGNTKRLSAELSVLPTTTSESATAVSDWWNATDIDSANLSLTLLTGDDLVPIYQLISDETKRAEVQRAVKAYIHSHQLQ